jgi:hypothetical protein
MNKDFLKKNILLQILTLFVILMLVSIDAISGEVTPSKSKSNVMDFEADVVEGERVAPSLFVQMDLGAPKMGTLMFQRKNFNDFHAIDMGRKPKYRVKGK